MDWWGREREIGRENNKKNVRKHRRKMGKSSSEHKQREND